MIKKDGWIKTKERKREGEINIDKQTHHVQIDYHHQNIHGKHRTCFRPVYYYYYRYTYYNRPS